MTETQILIAAIGVSFFIVIGLVAYLIASILWEMRWLTGILLVSLLVVCVLGVGAFSLAMDRMAEETKSQMLEYVDSYVDGIVESIDPSESVTPNAFEETP